MILNVEDKQTKFERSREDLGQFSKSLIRAQLSNFNDLRCFEDIQNKIQDRIPWAILFQSLRADSVCKI